MTTRSYWAKIPFDFPFYNATGTGTAAMANRISWFYNMVGPSVTLNTAYSSSLVGLHLGCQSLRTGESDMVSFLFSSPMFSSYANPSSHLWEGSM